MPHLHIVPPASFKLVTDTEKIILALTIDSVMPRQIPEPPPVQKSTFPLKMSALKTAFESTTWVTLDMVELQRKKARKLVGCCGCKGEDADLEGGRRPRGGMIPEAG